MAELPKTYDPSKVETDIYRRWEESGFFNPDKLPGKRAKPFVISMPPSNITGELHIGHMLGFTIQDILIRYRRMAGERTLWLPGTDHAAISTQVVVERELRQQGIDRRRLGREKFLKKVWAWKEKYGQRIIEQTKRVGASADWSRERFTMDDQLTKAVQTAFVKLYQDGYIYRGERIINWCSDCQTAISDLEVDHQDIPGKLWHITYPLADGSGHITVATTRPETMLGDTAVAVNPKDARYTKLVGRRVCLPVVGREVPIIADRRVDQDFGTGAVKVTPAHDSLDFDIGHDHGLERVQVIGFDGKMTEAAGLEFAGLSVERARTKVVERLRHDGALEKEEDYIHAIGFCQRSNTPIEPLVSRQWFMRMKKLAQPAIEAVRRGKIKILPEHYTKVYFHWMENIRDWNISRQIWWGHRLPVWHQKSDTTHESPKVSLTKPGSSWVQDEDTLDTWFSSGLWTFSTLGWPENTADLKKFHPTDVMETGWDILFFWVARMIMFSLYFRKEIPFRTVYLHGLILDEGGKKMSKSKGTGLDPLPLAEKYGMDAMRMSLVVGNAAGQDFRLYEKKVESYRNFSNKLWNVARFALAKPRPRGPIKVASLADVWILSKLQDAIIEVTGSLKSYDFSRAGGWLYNFIWHDFADWYIEVSKVYPNPAVQYRVLETVLKLLHPFMPFVTEEIWSRICPDRLLLVEPWPKQVAQWVRPAEAGGFHLLQQTAIALRNFKTHSGLPAGAQGNYVDPHERKIDAALLRALTNVIVTLESRLVPLGAYKELYLGPTKFQFRAEFVDRFESWRAKERQAMESYVAGLEKKLAAAQFTSHAPAAVVDQEREKLAAARARLLEL